MDEIRSEHFTQTTTFPCRFEILAKIGEFVVHAAKAAGLSQSAVDAVEMAVDEACANIIEHAHGGGDDGIIECTCRVNSDGLTVTLHDYGRPFDPASVPKPDIHAGLEERKEGGLGLYLIRQLMDEVHFEFRPDSGNVLTMVKRKETNS